MPKNHDLGPVETVKSYAHDENHFLIIDLSLW